MKASRTVGQAAGKICSKLGFAVRRIGEQGIVPLEEFSIERLDPELREVHRQIASLGCHFAVVERNVVPALIPELEPVSAEWLRFKQARERAFSAVPRSV